LPFDDDFDHTFDLIVRRFMGACEETESAVNEFTCAARRQTPNSWELRVMHEVPRRDGIVVLFGDDGDNDEIYVEAAIVAFVPINGNLRCGVCGAKVQPWSIRKVIGEYELTCSRCHCTQGRITTRAQTYR
jgi:hypothetical protein